MRKLGMLWKRPWKKLLSLNGIMVHPFKFIVFMMDLLCPWVEQAPPIIHKRDLCHQFCLGYGLKINQNLLINWYVSSTQLA